jgi:hypothetical protein
MRFQILCSLAAAGALSVTGCNTTEPAFSTIGGKIIQSTFPAPVQAITILSDRNVVASAPVEATTGAFELQLVWGSTYIFLLSPDGQGTPLVVRSDDQGDLEVEVTVVTGGLSASIGDVRYWGGAPSSTTTTTSTTPASCTGGVVQGTTQPCSSGLAVLACDGVVATNGDQGDQGNGSYTPSQNQTATPPAPKAAPKYHHHGGGDNGDSDDGTDEGGGDGILVASPTQPMAVPSLMLPWELGCVDDLSD